MKIFQALQKAIRYLLIKFVPGFRASTSKHVPSSNALNDPDLDYENDDELDDELKGWTRVYKDPDFCCEDHDDIGDRGQFASLNNHLERWTNQNTKARKAGIFQCEKCAPSVIAGRGENAEKVLYQSLLPEVRKIPKYLFLAVWGWGITSRENGGGDARACHRYRQVVALTNNPTTLLCDLPLAWALSVRDAVILLTQRHAHADCRIPLKSSTLPTE